MSRDPLSANPYISGILHIPRLIKAELDGQLLHRFLCRPLAENNLGGVAGNKADDRKTTNVMPMRTGISMAVRFKQYASNGCHHLFKLYAGQYFTPCRVRNISVDIF